MRTSRYVGLLAIGLGALMIVGAAVMPVGLSTGRFGPFRVDFSSDGCGPAGYVAFHRPGTDCGAVAAKRLEASTPVGMLVLAVGMALFAGGDAPHGSRIQVPTRRLRRSPGRRGRGGRRSVPG